MRSAPVDLKRLLLRRWLTLSAVWSVFWLASGTLDIVLRSGCHLGTCVFDWQNEAIRPIVILGPALVALPWVVTGVASAVFWLSRWAWRRTRARSAQ